MNLKELEHSIRTLLDKPISDAELREELESLATKEISFSGFTWLYGPNLYKRNKILFRPFVLSRFSSRLILPKWRIKAVPWKGAKAKILQAWLDEVDANDDVDLFKNLYSWRLEESGGWLTKVNPDKTIRGELIKRFLAAQTTPARQIVLRKLDLWFDLDEDTAVQLYETDSVASEDFIFRRLPMSWYDDGPKRKIWPKLLQLADQRADNNFRWKLYQRQVPLKQWTTDALKLFDQHSDPQDLLDALEKRHPVGWGINLSDGFYQIVQKGGRKALPYVQRHLSQVYSGWFSRGSYGKMADHARDQGWWDLWAALVRTCARPKEFNREVNDLVTDSITSEADVVQRLLALAGASREWNWGGLGVAQVKQLKEAVALKLYERFPALLHRAFKANIQIQLWGEKYPKLLKTFIEAEDEELIDYMASRLTTRCSQWEDPKSIVAEANELATYYADLKTNEVEFSRRSANVLSQVPAFSIWTYNPLIKQNRLARLLFERSAKSFLADPKAMADLIEGSEIHVIALAYRALGMDDDRARELAPQHLPLLLGTLLRPIQRATRILAFRALSNAADSIDSARIILDRAREALILPDAHYPKEQLLELIGSIIHQYPELRSPREQPVVYSKSA